ncbi:MAG: hypothetical protein FWD81_03225 [Methanomassiliicoccaceae archaeon]|nr:hypothetical protein [Methanomassiliicoccaceae archaeon]
MAFTVKGIRCGLPFDEIVAHFQVSGGDVILLNPNFVCGRDHIVSTVMHAERAFEHGTNRSRSLITETILYAAGERQISKALAKMRPADGSGEMVAVVFGQDDLRLTEIDAAEDDGLLKCTPDKIRNLGLDASGVCPEDLVLEMIALMDIQKQ